MTDDPKPPRLIHTTMSDAALDILRAARELDEWDLPPALVLIVEAENPTYVPVPVPDELWLDQHPAVVLSALAVGIGAGAIGLRIGEDQATNLQATGNIVGAILFTEGHAVMSENMTDAERATLDDFAKRHRLENHPKATELRMANMIDRHMVAAMAQHFRGQDVSQRIVYGITGRIPDALTKVVTAMLSRFMSDAQKAT